MCFVALKAWSNQLQAGLFYLTFWGCQTQGLLSFFFFFFWLWASCYLDRKSLFGDSWNVGVPSTPLRIWGRSPALTLQHTSLADTDPWLDGLPSGFQTAEEPYSTLRVKQNLVRNFEIGLSCPLCPFCFPRLPLSFSTLPDFRLLEIPPLYPIRLTL